MTSQTASKAARQAFTALEALMVTAMISLMLLIGIAGYQQFKRRSNIVTISHELAAYVERARLLSLVSYNASRYGIHFDQNQYVLFKAPTYQAGGAGNEVKQLPGFRFVNPQVFANGQGGFTQEVFFSGLTGQTQNTGTIRLESTADSSLFRLIGINDFGVLSVQ